MPFSPSSFLLKCISFFLFPLETNSHFHLKAFALGIAWNLLIIDSWHFTLCSNVLLERLWQESLFACPLSHEAILSSFDQLSLSGKFHVYLVAYYLPSPTKIANITKARIVSVLLTILSLCSTYICWTKGKSFPFVLP